MDDKICLKNSGPELRYLALYKNTCEAIYNLAKVDEAEARRVLWAWLVYGYLGEETADLSEQSRNLIFPFIKNDVDRSLRHRINAHKGGLNGGAPQGNQNARKYPTSESTKSFDSEDVESEMLNRLANSRY